MVRFSPPAVDVRPRPTLRTIIFRLHSGRGQILMAIRALSIMTVVWLLVGSGTVVFVLNTLSVVSKLLCRNAMNVYDAASGILLVSSIIFALGARHHFEATGVSFSEYPRVKKTIGFLVAGLFAITMISIVTLIAASRMDGITASTAPLLKIQQQYLLESHSRLAEVTRYRYLIVGISCWLAKLFFETAFTLVLALSVLNGGGAKGVGKRAEQGTGIISNG